MKALIATIALVGLLGTTSCGQGEGDAPPIQTHTQRLTAFQNDVLSFEDEAAWTSETAELSLSSDSSEDSTALAITIHGYTEITSINIVSPKPVRDQATFDLKLLQDLPWGQARLIVVVPSQGHSWRDVGGVDLTALAPGTFHTLSFDLPGDLQTALESGASDLSFKIVLNGPPGSRFILDNLVLSDDTGGSGTGQGTAYELSLPVGVLLDSTALAASDYLKIEDAVLVTGQGDFSIVNTGVGQLELGADAALGSNGQNISVITGGDAFLRDRSKIHGDLSAALAIIRQSTPLEDAVLGTPKDNTPLILDPPLQHTVKFTGGNDVEHLEVGEARPLSPAHYGALILKPGARLQLSTGAYYFDSIDAQSTSMIELADAQGPTIVYVKGGVKHQARVLGAAAEERFMIVALTSGMVDIDAPFRGTVFAPNGFLRLSPVDGSGHSGSFFGRSLEVGARNPIRFVPFQYWDWLSPAELELNCSELKASIEDVKGDARNLWRGKEIASAGHALSTTPEFEVEFDRTVRGDHPLAWFRPIECEGDVLAVPLGPNVESNTIKFVPQGTLLRGCTYRFIIARYQALGPDGACLSENFELEFRVAAYDEPHDFALAQRANGDGPLSYFLLRDGVKISPEEAFRRYERDIGVSNLSLRRGQKFESSWRDKTQWSYVQHVGGYPVRGAGYTVEIVESDGEEELHSAIGHLVTDLDIAESPNVSEADALSSALSAIGLNSAHWTTLPVGELIVWASSPATLGAPARHALAWRFPLRRADLQNPSTSLEVHTVWVDATTSEILERESVIKHDSYLRDAPGTVEYQDLGPLHFTAAEWELSVGGTEFRVTGLSDSANRIVMFDEFGLSQTTSDPDGNAYWETTEGDVSGAALLMQTAQAARPFIEGLNLLGGWKGFDGDDGSPLTINFYPPGVLPPDGKGVRANIFPTFTPGDNIFISYGWPAPYNNFEVLPHVLVHEFGHVVNNHSRLVAGKSIFATSGDADAIHEGVSDIFGIAYANNVLADPAWSTNPIFTYAPSADPNERNVADPWITQNPRIVGDKNFGSDGHTNSTIVSRWAYLLGTGDNTVAGACNLPVSSLVSGDVAASLTRVLRIASDAFFEASDTPSFATFRQNTEDAASRLYDKTTAKRVAEAWMAVGVGGSSHAAVTNFAPAAVSNVHPWKVEFSWEAMNSDWEMQLATTKDGLDAAPVEQMRLLSDGMVRRAVALEPGQEYWWRARLAGANSWTGCSLIESSFETAEVPIELATNAYSLPWKGKENEIYRPGYRGIVSWMHVPGAEYELFFGKNSGPSACSGSPVEMTTGRFATLEPWDDFWSNSEGPGLPGNYRYAPFTSEIDQLPNEVHTIGIRPRPVNSAIQGVCHEFPVRKRIIEHFTQDWPQLDDHPSVSFDPEVSNREHDPDILPPPDFLFTPATHVRPGRAVPAVEGYRLKILRWWAEDRIGMSETVYDEYQSVAEHPKLITGKWEFAPASYSWLGQPANKPDANYFQQWELYAVVDGQERPAALAPGTYEFVDPKPNQVLWGASDMPPGHFMWPDAEYGADFIKSAATWDEIAATRRVEEVGGEDRVVYTINWTLEIDTFWEEHGVPVYAGSPAGPMSGYYLQVFGRVPEVGTVEVTEKNFLKTGFGGVFNKSDHPRFMVGAEGSTFVAAIVEATPITRSEGEIYWAGDPTIVEFNVHWVDYEVDSTICGKRGQQCCRPDDSCDWGDCGQDEPDTCSGCGRIGESCCENEKCESGTTCEDGSCTTIPRCDGEVREGGNFGETVPVEMGKSSGRGLFSMLTFDAQDKMTVRGENGNIILQTPCIGTNFIRAVAARCEQGGLDIYKKCVTDDGVRCFFHEGVQSRTCQLTDGWICHIDTGVCSRPFEYSGGSKITVEVTPNCGDTNDTLWAFEVACP